MYALSTCLSTRWVEDGFASDHANPFVSLCRCPMEPTCHACGSTAHSKRDCPNTEKMCDLCGRVILCFLFHECLLAAVGRSGCGRALTVLVLQIGHLKIKCRLAAGGGGNNRGGGGSGGGECHTCGGFGHRECSYTMMTYIRHLPQFITRLPCDESVCMCVFAGIF